MAMEGIEAHDTQVQGLRVHYYTAGQDGLAVILLHGGGTDSALLSWREVIPALGEAHRVYAPDWPGYGQSHMFSGDYALEKLAAIVLDLMN